VWGHPRWRAEAWRRLRGPRWRPAPDGGREGGTQPTDSRRSNRRGFLAPALPMPRGETNRLKTSKNLRPTLDIGSHSNAGPQPRPKAVVKRRLEGVGCRVEPVVTHLAPPQTRTCAIHAYGSSDRAAATPPQSPGVPCSGLVSSMSLPCLPPADALPDGAFPPVGRLGLTSPPSPVLCAATTATVSLSGRFAWRSLPDPWPASVAFVVSPAGSWPGESRPVTPGPVVTRSPYPG
jgi:hypothetical protein